MGLVTFIIVLSVMIFIHELGHFLAARYFGVTVHTFSIGFGKKIYSKMYRGTEWAISMIPLGGYVQMKGQSDTNPTLINEDNDSYNIKKPWQRIIILLAGPFANFFLAGVLYFTIAIMGSHEIAPKIGDIVPDSPAQLSGLKSGDVIEKIDDKEIRSWNELSRAIKDSAEETIVLQINRNGLVGNAVVYPKIGKSINIFGETIQRRMVGISPAKEFVTIERGFFESVWFACEKTYEASKLIFQGLQKLISGIIPSSEIGGVISIGKVISDASDVGIIALFSISALISVNLGVLNLLPIPALDGGHIIFNIYEMIIGKKPNQKVLLNLTIAGWIILLGLMSLGFYNDINRLIAG